MMENLKYAEESSTTTNGAKTNFGKSLFNTGAGGINKFRVPP